VVVHHVPEIVHHVPEIVHHVHLLVALAIALKYVTQVVADAMIGPVQLATFPMVVQSVIHEVFVQHRWIAIHRAFVHEFSSQIFPSM
jgi:hypothetical protein